MRAASHLRYPLDRLFSRPSQVAILRALQHNREGMSGRAIARQAGINHQTCALALRHLESLGLIRRRGAGRTQLIALNFDNHLLRDLALPLFRKEQELLAQLRRDVTNAFKGTAMTITLFGSVARGEDVPGSDMDVLFVSDGPDKPRVLKDAMRYSAELKNKYGVHLSPIVMTPREVRRRAAKSEPLLKNILREGVDLLPQRLREQLR